MTRPDDAERRALIADDDPTLRTVMRAALQKDGFDACAQIRGLPGGADTPIVMVTGRDDIDAVNRAYGVGATEYAGLIHSGFTLVEVPESIRFELTGELPAGVTAKDVILYILKHYATREDTLDRVMEFGGPGLASLCNEVEKRARGGDGSFAVTRLECIGREHAAVVEQLEVARTEVPA